ncbi:MAG: hypothetical protein ACLUEK_06075 [Oscillospiraceae bacterium]
MTTSPSEEHRMKNMDAIDGLSEVCHAKEAAAESCAPSSPSCPPSVREYPGLLGMERRRRASALNRDRGAERDYAPLEPGAEKPNTKLWNSVRPSEQPRQHRPRRKDKGHREQHRPLTGEDAGRNVHYVRNG